MRQFEFFPHLHEYETPEGYVSRLAAYNGLGSVSELYKLVGIRTYDRRTGFEDSMMSIGAMAGLDSEDFVRYQVDRTPGISTLNGQRVLSKHVGRMRARYCPVCVARDMAGGEGPLASRPFQRFWWPYLAIEQCVEHGCDMMVSNESRPINSPEDFVKSIAENHDRIMGVATRHVDTVVDPFERYLWARLVDDVVPVPLLDMVPLYVSVMFCEAVGKLRKTKPTTKNPIVDGSDDTTYRREGFELISRGNEEFFAYLEERVRGEKDARRMTKLTKYGQLFKMVQRRPDDPDFKPLTEVLLEDALATIPFAAGDEILGHVVEKRRLHNVHSASEEYGISPSTISKWLRDRDDQNGELTKGSYFVFPVEAVEHLTRLRDTLTEKQVKQKLGVAFGAVHSLVDAGIIGVMQFSAIFQSERPRYLATDVERLQEEIAAIPVVTKIPDGYRLVNMSHSWAHVSQGLMYSKIRVGAVRAVRVGKQAEFKSVYAHYDDAIAATALPAAAGLSMSKAARKLKTAMGSVKRLVSAGYLRTEYRTHEVTRRKTDYLDESEVTSFAEKYVGVADYAADYGCNPGSLLRALLGAGLKPLFEPCFREAHFFARADIDAFVAGADKASLRLPKNAYFTRIKDVGDRGD